MYVSNLRTILFCAATALFVFPSCFAFAQQSVFAQQSETEYWSGTLDVKVAKLRLELELTRDDDKGWSGKMISLDQGNAVLPFTKFQRTKEALTFEIKRFGIKFDGQFSEEGDAVSGTFIQGGKNFRSSLKRAKRQDRYPIFKRGKVRCRLAVRISIFSFGYSATTRNRCLPNWIRSQKVSLICTAMLTTATTES
jgi:hypothetical protein